MNKNTTYITPIGTIKFPKTIFPDGKEIGNITVPEDIADGDQYIWELGLAFDHKDQQAKQLLDDIAEMEKNVKNLNFHRVKKDKSRNPDTEQLEETGLVLINFKSFFKPTIVDSKKQAVSQSLGWGTKARIAFAMKAVDNKGKRGIGAYMKAIQVAELQESQDISIFDEIQGGYESTQTEVTRPEDIEWEE